MTSREKLQWEQEINELSACDAAIEELVDRWCPRSKWSETQQAMYPKLQPEGVLAEPATWKKPTKMEYLSGRRSQYLLHEREWFEKLRAKLLPELLAIAGVEGAEAEAKFRKQLVNEMMPRSEMAELIHPRPKKA